MRGDLKRARTLLEQDVPVLWQRLNRKRCRTLLSAFSSHLAEQPLSRHEDTDPEYFQGVLLSFLRGEVARCLNRMQTLQGIKQQFDGRFARAASRREQQALLLDHARELGATPRQLRQDRRALRRWFGVDALRDRWQIQLADQEQQASFALERLGALCTAALRQEPEPDRRASFWSSYRFDDLCERLFELNTDHRLQEAGLKALARALQSVDTALPVISIGPALQQQIYRLALDADAPVWLQRRGLELLAMIDGDALVKTLRYRFEQPGEADDLFVRAAAVELWRHTLPAHPELAGLLDTLCADPAALVRQRLAQQLPELHGELGAELLNRLDLLAGDAIAAVRGSSVLALADLANRAPYCLEDVARRLNDLLQRESDPFVYRTLLEAIQRIGPALTDTSHGTAAAQLLDTLDRRHSEDPSLKVRRWSAQAREKLLACLHSDWRQALATLRSQLARDSGDIDLTQLPDSLSDAVLMRLLAILAQDDHGLDVRFRNNERMRVRRGYRFGFRWWRWLYEWRHPSTDKRQGFRHTVGRQFSGTDRAPSTILAEVSRTKVPGEPFTFSDEDGWRPYLPLVDECLAALDQERRIRPHRIFTSEGVTRIDPPPSLAGQVKAWWRLSRRFHQFDEWRNWRDSDAAPATTYIEALQALGFRIQFFPHDNPVTGRPAADPAVQRFFPALAPLPLISDLLTEFKRHALSAYENTVFELAAYVGLIGAFFFGRHIILAQLLRRARNRIPLVVGGWGTRGKSGTERLKAAMFNALGLSVFSKTTGCEAMFVMNRPYRELRELFLFRPYDKATIWEQFNMVRLASRLKADVFLWECMGLTPSYIRVLQRDWMRDDISTITNAFPDHEDLQGPAGINIPQVMCEFIPPRSRLVTSEEKMLPILRDGARQRHTELRPVGWLEAGLLTPDVLARFPYEEHPYNIALVLGLADELGIDRDQALKEMADRVVLDLGVLKTYPEARVNGRRLQFIMGMSANERYGALNNWQRMGMETPLPAKPHEWITTLVNNRADRVPRSRVFADILVKDIAADQHVLIGTNLQGMRGYIEEAWADWVADVSLWSAAGTAAGPAAMLESYAQRFRIPTTLAALKQRIAALHTQPLLQNDATSIETLRQIVASAFKQDDARTWAERFLADHESYQALSTRLQQLGDKPADAERQAFDQVLRDQLWRWFERKLLIVEDAHISGDALISRMAAAAPPALQCRIMGMQNIKGTGLGFVYCWQAYEQQWQLAEALSDPDDATFSRALDQLANLPDLGLLARETLLAQLEQARHHPAAQREAAQAQITRLESRLGAIETGAGHPQQRQSATGVWMARLLDGLEAMLDAGDAVRRRRRADQVYRDLVSARISEERAIVEIKAVNQRQKGGWLRRRLGL